MNAESEFTMWAGNESKYWEFHLLVGKD